MESISMSVEAVVLKPLDDAIYDKVAEYVDKRDNGQLDDTTASTDIDIDSI